MMVPTIEISTAGDFVMPKRAVTGYAISVCDAYIEANSIDVSQSILSRYTLATAPMTIGMTNVSAPNTSPRFRLSFR